MTITVRRWNAERIPAGPIRVGHVDAPAEDTPVQLRIMRTAVAVAILLVLIKAIGFVLTGSVALLASLIDSAIDALASAVGWVAVRQALVPPDAEHRFGHGKIESIAALGQAAFISGTAMLLLLQAAQRALQPQPIENSAVGIGIAIASLVITGWLIRAQQSAYRQSASLVVRADSVHYLADFLGYFGLLAALIAGGLFGLLWVDPLVGALIGLYLLVLALRVGRVAFNELLDREFEESERARLVQAAMGIDGVRGVHDLRTRRAGPQVFVQMHVEINGATPLTRAHALTNRVAEAIRTQYPDADVLIHADPENDSEWPHEHLSARDGH